MDLDEAPIIVDQNQNQVNEETKKRLMKAKGKGNWVEDENLEDVKRTQNTEKKSRKSRNPS